MKIENLVLVCCLLILLSCNSKQAKYTYENINSSENFQDFHAKFYSDSLFQLSRINFPIPERIDYNPYVPTDLDTNKTTLLWNKENWVFLNFDSWKGQNYKHEIKDSLHAKLETYGILNSSIYSAMEFKLIKGKWYLVYYFEGNF